MRFRLFWLFILAILLLWRAPTINAITDTDGDTWSDGAEATIGTNPNLACGFNAWPADFNNDGYSDVSDMNQVTTYFGQSVPPAPARSDVAPDPPNGFVDITDTSRMSALFGSTCTTTYYIDSACAGCDSNSGLDTAHPWQTIGKVNAQNQAGKTFRFKKGGVWTEKLLLNTASVTRIDSYGAGAVLPKINTNQAQDCVQASNAQYLTIKNIQVENCLRSGIRLGGASSLNLIVDHVKANANVQGVWLESTLPTSFFTHVDNSTIVDNNRLAPPPNDDSGAFGILVNGGKLWMENNDCNGQDAASNFFDGRDGSCVEFYSYVSNGAAGSVVRKNRAVGNDAFTETGASSGASQGGISYIQNAIYASGSVSDGINIPNPGNTLLMNTVVVTGSTGQALVTSALSTGLTVRDNIFVGGLKAAYFGTAPTSEGYNLFKGQVQNLTPAASDLVQVDPLLDVDHWHQTASSPTIDKGDPAALETNVSANDMDNDLIPQDGDANGSEIRDIGTDERP